MSSKPTKWKTYQGRRPTEEVARLRQLVSHREQAYFDVLSEGLNAATIGRRAVKLKEAKDALKRALGRRARG